MRFRCIRSVENFPGRPGRLRFVVRFGVLVESNDETPWEQYGAPALEALFLEPNALAHLRSPEGITRPFERVDDALDFIAQVKQAIADTPSYWQLAGAFPGRED
jgi:hypothetical protein